jgi:hypothetical protein
MLANASLLSIVPCARCAKACLIRSPLAPPADRGGLVVLVPATTARGLCEECAAHWWIFSVDGFRWAFQDGPGVLCWPAVQRELSRLLGWMHPALGAIDWQQLLNQWDLPWPDDWALPSDVRPATVVMCEFRRCVRSVDQNTRRP